MSNADQWDALYSKRAMADYPPNELVRLVSKYYGKLNPAERRATVVLELGCGAGSTTWYLAREGFMVHAVEQSGVAIQRTRARLNNDGLGAALSQMSFENYLGENQYDFVVDVSSLHYCRDISKILVTVAYAMKPRARFFSITPSVASDIEPFELGMKLSQCAFHNEEGIRHLYGQQFEINEIAKSTYTTSNGYIELLTVDAVRK